ncbi:MAG: acyltransferase family protein [Candidatus Devosia euplotis]|nr:acyltransferase family protein [Candidatus Devosia euplotis]
MSAAGNRLDWVDMAKGLSIFLVMMMYAASSVCEDTGGGGAFHWAIAFATLFRMPEFFLISGLLLSQAIDRPWRAFADRRVVHYLYFYGLWALIHIVFKVGLLATNPLGMVGAVTRLLHILRAPVWVVFAWPPSYRWPPSTPAATPSIGLPLISSSSMPAMCRSRLFRLAAWAGNNIALTLAGLAVRLVIHTALVFSPGFAMQPVHPVMGWAGLPGCIWFWRWPERRPCASSPPYPAACRP